MDSMLSKALREFFSGPLKQLLVNIGGEKGDKWEKELNLFLRGEPCWVNKPVPTPEPPPLLTYSALEQVANLLRWKEAHKLPFTYRQICDMQIDAPQLALGPLEACVLVPYLDTVEHTFEFWMKVLKYTHPNFSRWPGLMSNEKHLRILSACAPFPANTLRWEVIDLLANWDKEEGTSLESVQGEKSPHFGVYAVLAHNPSFASKMDGKTVPRLWVPGLEVTVGGSEAWASSPSCYWDSDYRGLSASAFRSGGRDWSYSVPVLRGVYKA